MARRFGIGADAAFTGVLIAALLVLWMLRGTNLNATSIAVGLAAPSCAAFGLILLVIAIPALVGDGPMRRPRTFTLPALFVSLTLFCAKAMLTTPNATTAVHEQLVPATLWLSPAILLGLFCATWGALELTHFRNLKTPVS